MIQIDFAVYWMTALLLLILPLDWFLAAITASAIHEMSHMLAVFFLNGRILKIRVQTGGCVIDACEMGLWQQFFSILAGPLGSFLLLGLCHTAPKIAICGLLQGLYNLIPVLPLDGGRLLRLLLYRFYPQRSDVILDCVAVGSCVMFDILAVQSASAGLWPFLFAVIWNLKVLPGKIPCKLPGIRVQ